MWNHAPLGMPNSMRVGEVVTHRTHYPEIAIVGDRTRNHFKLGLAQPGRALALGARSRRSKSCIRDQISIIR